MDDSESNLKAVRLFYIACNHADDDGLLTFFDPDGEIEAADETGRDVAGARYRGFAGVRKYMSGVRRVLEKPVVTIEDLKADGDKVAASITIRGTAATTGEPITIPVVHFFEFRDGLIRCLRTHRGQIDELQRDGWR